MTKSTLILVLSLVMLIGAIIVDMLAWFQIIAKDEPKVVLHLSTFALIFSAIGNVLTANVNKEVKK